MTGSNTKRIIIVFAGRFPSEKAAGLFVDLNARALMQAGAAVTVLAPRRLGRLPLGSVPYGVRYLPTIDLSRVPVIWGISNFLSVWVFSKWVFLWLLVFGKRDDLVISNDAWPLLVASLLQKNTMFEMHDFVKDTWMYRTLLRRVRTILVTNTWKHDELISTFSVPSDRIMVQRNAVDVRAFGSIDKQSARVELKLDATAPTIVYTGHLYEWKGADTLAKSARSMPDVRFYFVGGSPEDAEKFRNAYGATPNLNIIGHQAHERMPLWQAAADVLVLPNSGKEEISVHYTSPMKLFEYMASSRPIVASDLPSIREVLGESGYYATPDDPASFEHMIRSALSDTGERVALARSIAEANAWETRSQRILQRTL